VCEAIKEREHEEGANETLIVGRRSRKRYFIGKRNRLAGRITNNLIHKTDHKNLNFQRGRAGNGRRTAARPN